MGAIPEYRADQDRYCPRAQVRKYNENNKLQAKLLEDQSKVTSKWVSNTMKSHNDSVPLKLKPSLRSQALSSINNTKSLAEIEILEKIIVRENLLSELNKLLQNQSELYGCINEVVELVKAIRFQTVDIIEDIDAWQCIQPSPRPFLFRGMNYLLKVLTDLDYLDQYEEIIEKFCFEFKGNPLAYRGGGDLITPPGQSNFYSQNNLSRYSAYYNEKGSIDGVEVIRLRNAEKIIQKEIDRFEKEKSLLQEYSTTPNTTSATFNDASSSAASLQLPMLPPLTHNHSQVHRDGNALNTSSSTSALLNPSIVKNQLRQYNQSLQQSSSVASLPSSNDPSQASQSVYSLQSLENSLDAIRNHKVGQPQPQPKKKSKNA